MALRRCSPGVLEFLTYPLDNISSSDHLSPEVDKTQLQKVQKNLSFPLQVSSGFSSFILPPWPHCQFSCILCSPMSRSSSWHRSAVSQLSLTSRLPPGPTSDAAGCPVLWYTLQRAPRTAGKPWAAWGLPHHRLCYDPAVLSYLVAPWGLLKGWQLQILYKYMIVIYLNRICKLCQRPEPWKLWIFTNVSKISGETVRLVFTSGLHYHLLMHEIIDLKV